MFVGGVNDAFNNRGFHTEVNWTGQKTELWWNRYRRRAGLGYASTSARGSG
jgi:hypothetical protein